MRQRLRLLHCVILMVGIWLPATASRADEMSVALKRMVDDEIVVAGIKNPRVIAAMCATPRPEFVPPDQRSKALFDMALPIGHGQSISPPFVVAYMTEQLDPQPADRVLEVGTGSGYQAAVLSPLVADVYTIEIQEPLGQTAAATLARLGYKNVHTRIGDGYQGWPDCRTVRQDRRHLLAREGAATARRSIARGWTIDCARRRAISADSVSIPKKRRQALVAGTRAHDVRAHDGRRRAPACGAARRLATFPARRQLRADVGLRPPRPKAGTTFVTPRCRPIRQRPMASTLLPSRTTYLAAALARCRP